MHKHPILSFLDFLVHLLLHTGVSVVLLAADAENTPCGTVCRQAHLAVLLWMGLFASLLGSEKHGDSWLQVSLGHASMGTTLSISL